MILDCIGGKGKSVKTIVIVEAFDGELVSQGAERGVEIISLEDFEVRVTNRSIGSWSARRDQMFLRFVSFRLRVKPSIRSLWWAQINSWLDEESSIQLLPFTALMSTLNNTCFYHEWLISASQTRWPRYYLLHFWNHRCAYSSDNSFVLTLVFYFIQFSLLGNPKGAMLTHRNVVSNTAAFIKITKVNPHTCFTWDPVRTSTGPIEPCHIYYTFPWLHELKASLFSG